MEMIILKTIIYISAELTTYNLNGRLMLGSLMSLLKAATEN